MIVDLGRVNAEQAARYQVAEGSKLLEHDFVLVTEQESNDLRGKLAMEAMEKQGRKMKLWQGLPVPDVD